MTKREDATARALLVLSQDVADLVANAERVRVQMGALAAVHGVESPAAIED